uniref:non-specific serine/threonine protein kinase n=2 Tax=Chenopodium quinoa TaxID=63459 RepID=A0A803M4A7_CHEQI
MKFFQLHVFISQTIWHIIFLVIFCFPTCFGSDLQLYDSCGNYFRCGNVKAGFPFWGGDTRPKECGFPDLELSCENNATTTIQSKGMKYHVLDINQNTQVLKMAREDFLQGICMQKFINTTIDPELFDYAPGSRNLTVLYGCPPPYTPNPSQFTCKIYGTNDTDGYPVEGAIGPSGCFASIVVPVVDSSAAQIRKWSSSQIIGKGFEAIYKVQGEDLCVECEASKGRCGFDLSKNKISCLCLDGSIGDTPCNNSISSAKSENLRYPFWGENRAPYCGLPGYELQCLGNDVPIITITSQKYRFLKADAEAHKLIVARDDFWDDLCPSSLVNTSINNSPFEYPFNPVYLTLCYDCPIASMISLGFLGYSVCNESGSFIDVCFKTGVYTPNIGCRSVVNIPILKTLAPELKIDKASVLKALRDGFKLQWKVNDDQCKTCVESGGQCGNDLHGNKFTCFCPDQPYASECPTPSGMFDSSTQPSFSSLLWSIKM